MTGATPQRTQTRRLSPRGGAWLTNAATLLVGCTIGMTIASSVRAVTDLLSTFDVPGPTVVSAGLLALGAGVIVPMRFALWLLAGARQRMGIGASSDHRADYLMSSVPPDRRLFWSVLSVIALGTGVSIVLTPAAIQLGHTVLHSLSDRFVWSAAPKTVLYLSAAWLMLLLPLGLPGLAVSCVHHLSCSRGRWEPGATIWLLAGAATGCFLSNQAAAINSNVMVPMLAAALPAFTLSILCMGLASIDRNAASAFAADDDDADTPLFSDRYPRLTRIAVVAVGGGGGCAVYVWFNLLQQRGLAIDHFLAGSLLALAVGTALGRCATQSMVRNISSFGLACGCSGAIVALAASRNLSRRSQGMDLAMILVAIGSIGVVVSLGRSLLMCRVGSRSREGARITARILCCAALSIGVVAPAVVSLFGTIPALVMLALSLLALGGILIVHDSTADATLRRVRLAFVFGAIGLMIALGSSNANPWRQTTQSRVVTYAGKTQ